MNIVRWKPWKPFEDFAALSRNVDRWLGTPRRRDVEYDTDTSVDWAPAADIYETENDFVLKVEIPGMKKEDVEVVVKDNVLSVKGEKKVEKEVKREDYHRVESMTGTFNRRFSLPRNVNSKEIAATMKNGVLELRIPKAEEAKLKAIPITVN